MSEKPTESIEQSAAPVAEKEQTQQLPIESTTEEQSVKKDVQTDDQPGEETYKRGQRAKWTKTRKGDTDGRQSKRQKNNQEACVCLDILNRENMSMEILTFLKSVQKEENGSQENLELLY